MFYPRPTVEPPPRKLPPPKLPPPIPDKHLTELWPGDACPRCERPLAFRTPKRPGGRVAWFLWCKNPDCRTTTVLTRNGLIGQDGRQRPLPSSRIGPPRYGNPPPPPMGTTRRFL